MNEFRVKTIRYFTSGTPADRTCCSIPVKYRRVLAMEISPRGTIIFPDTTYLYVRINYNLRFSGYGNNPHRFVYRIEAFIGSFSKNRF